MKRLNWFAALVIGCGGLAASPWAVADEWLTPGDFFGISVEASPESGDTTDTFSVEAHGNVFWFMLDFYVPRNKPIVVRVDGNVGQLINTTTGDVVDPNNAATVTWNVDANRNLRVSIYELETYGPGLAPGSYEYMMHVDMSLGWDWDGDGVIEDSEFFNLINAMGSTSFMVDCIPDCEPLPEPEEEEEMPFEDDFGDMEP